MDRAMERAIHLLNRAANSNTTTNVLIATAFGVLFLRSSWQQTSIEQLEAEKDSLVKSNKAMTKTIWEWKQSLYSEAESNPQKALVPLSTLKYIYGEAAPSISGGDDTQDKKSAPKFMV